MGQEPARIGGIGNRENEGIRERAEGGKYPREDMQCIFKICHSKSATRRKPSR